MVGTLASAVFRFHFSFFRLTKLFVLHRIMNMFGGDDIDAVIMGGGITFRGGPKKEKNPREAEKVKTKAKKKQYITGAHGSGAAKKKADIRRQRANRHKK